MDKYISSEMGCRGRNSNLSSDSVGQEKADILRTQLLEVAATHAGLCQNCDEINDQGT